MNLSPEHLGMVYEFDFQFADIPNIWLRTDVTVEEAFECLKTGLLNNRVVTRIKAFAITNSPTSVSFVYDINAAKSGSFPWTLLPSS